MKQQLLRAVEPPGSQELMRRLAKRLLKGSEKVIGRKTGHPGHFVYREGLVEGGGDELFRAMESPVQFLASRSAHRRQGFDLPAHAVMNLQQPLEDSV